MFDIILQATTEQIDKTGILLTCLAGNLTIFAFGYPYIYRAINNLSRISSILADRVARNKFRSYYSVFLIVVFISNAISLIWSYSICWCIVSVILLLLHIFYIMKLYQIIDKKFASPFNAIINKEIHKLDSQFKNIDELENDISLIIDIICYFEKNVYSEPDLSKYFNWLIDVTFLKLNNFDILNYDWFLGVGHEDAIVLFSTLYKLQWLNQWAINKNAITNIDYINNFYTWILEYGIIHPVGFNEKVHPILKKVKTCKDLYAKINNKIDDLEMMNIEKRINFIKYIQNLSLEHIKQIIIYRIQHNFISNYEMDNFVNLFYFILSRKLNTKQNDKFEPCFSIISKMIDNDISEMHYNQMLTLIQKNHDYFFNENVAYCDVCKFHINVMAYFIFRNQYQKLKSYMYYEESPERTTQHTKPQIPNRINNILFIFIGIDSIFYNTQTFSANISSRKYKFYVLFLLLINSKKYADFNRKNLSKIDNKDWQYEFIKREFDEHWKCSIDFSNIAFDDLMSYLTIENYKEYFESFKKETELLNIFEYDENNENFINRILSAVVKEIKKARKKLLTENFKNIAVKEFSFYTQKDLGVQNLKDLIKIKIRPLFESIQKLNFDCKDTSDFKKHTLNLYEETCNKEKLLSGEYRYLFNGKPTDNFYLRLFNLIIDNCIEIPSIKDLPLNIENYKILSNIQSKKSFITFGFNENDIIAKSTIVNGKRQENYIQADVQTVKINKNKINTSKYNHLFHYLNNNGTYPSTILFFDSTKISITIGEKQPIQFKDLNQESIKILDNTQITIKVPKEKELGYFIKQNKDT